MRYLLISIVFFLAFSVCNAQTAPKKKSSRKTPEQKAENKANKLSQQLSLTPEQTQQLKTLFLECDQQLDSLYRQERAIKAKRDNGLKQTLTPEQYKTYKDIKTSRKSGTGSSPAAAVTPAVKQ